MASYVPPAEQYEDLVGSSDKLMRKLANEQMGPLLDQMGVSEEPFSFFIDLLKVHGGHGYV